MRVMLLCDECFAELEPEKTRRPFMNLCFVCALAVYIERLAAFALKRETSL